MIWGIGQYSATFNEGELFAPDKYLTDYYTDEALKVIENNKNRPFFLYLPHSMPHVPLGVSSQFKGKSKQGMYGDVMMEIDWSVGQIMRTLSDLSLIHI